VNTALNTRLTVTKAILWFLVGLASVVAVARFAFGLGAMTALTDRTPWGLWIGFDVLSGVALAAGGFVIAGTVHVLSLKRYEPLVRPAVLTAFLGYLGVVFGLLADLGRPWNIWRMTFYWQPHSPLFEVGWCVMLYLTVLALEFAPVALEGLGWRRALAFVKRFTLILIVLGIALSTLHQSSLGTLFLLVKQRMYPLWYSPILPILFLTSAIGLGLCMVTFESLASAWLYHRKPERELLQGPTRAAAVIIALYLVLRLGDLAWRGQLGLALQPRWTSVLFFTEILLSSILPIALFTVPFLRRRAWALPLGAGSAVVGFILQRASVGGLASVSVTGDPYIPSLSEIVISLGIVGGLALAFLMLAEWLPVWHERPETATPLLPSPSDSLTHSYVRASWLAPAQIAGLAWLVGALCGVVLAQVTLDERADPVASAVRAPRTVWVTTQPRADGRGHQLSLVPPGALTAAALPEAGARILALAIDGTRPDRTVLFAHRAHQERLGGEQSCAVCHHRNARHDRGTPCGACHRDMYRTTDVFSHERHVAALDGNRSCARCHQAGQPRSRATALSCDDAQCHGPDTNAQARVARDAQDQPGMAVGYRKAMHGLCVHCHQLHEVEIKAQEPFMSRCSWCHTGSAPTPRTPAEPAGNVVAQRME
jgi:Ni/Fe-hydrogenase subunit HybB-like protein